MNVDLTDSQRVDLEQAYNDYRAAVGRVRGSLDLSDATAEEVVASRLALCRNLMRTGWLPPPTIEVQLRRDAALLEAPGDFQVLLAEA